MESSRNATSHTSRHPALVHDAVEQSVEERRVGLRPDRDPLRRHRPGDREVRLDLHALEPARAGVGLAPYPGDPGRGLRVVAAAYDVAAARGVGRHNERAVPQLAVQVLAVVALHALPRPEPHVDRPPGGEEGGQGPHVLGRGAAPAEAHREPRKSGLVDEPPGADVEHAGGNRVERLVPADRHEAGVLAAALARIGALHGLAHAVRVVGLLDEAVGLDAHPPAAGVVVARVEVRADPGRDPVLDLDLHQIRAGDALVAVDGLPDPTRALAGAVAGSVSAHPDSSRSPCPEPFLPGPNPRHGGARNLPTVSTVSLPHAGP